MTSLIIAKLFSKAIFLLLVYVSRGPSASSVFDHQFQFVTFLQVNAVCFLLKRFSLSFFFFFALIVSEAVLVNGRLSVT